jgi:hypothetical protein
MKTKIAQGRYRNPSRREASGLLGVAAAPASSPPESGGLERSARRATRPPLGSIGRWIVLGTLAFAVLTSGGCMMLMGLGIDPPPASEFGFGPRLSARGAYEATIEPLETLRVRRMQQVKLTVRSTDGSEVGDAVVTIDGGMPQHGHGLPTKPRVTGVTEEGAFLIDGIRFNMGGWWELKFAIATPSGTDTVTFNLKL